MLTDLDRATLDFAGITWRYPGARDAAIAETFRETPVRYHQRLLALIERADAEVEYPTLVRRLRRVRDARAGVRRGRAEPPVGIEPTTLRLQGGRSGL